MSEADIGEALAEVRGLVRDGTEMDRRLDAMLQKASVIGERLSAMKEFQTGIEQMQTASHTGDRRQALLSELQQENRLIMSYQEENHMLKDALEKSYSTLDEIMQRHRSLMSRIRSDAAFVNFSPELLGKILNTPFTCEAATNHSQFETSRKLLEIMAYCEQLSHADAKRIARLGKENTVLRELLNYSRLSDSAVLSVFRTAMAEYERNTEESRSSASDSEDEEEEANTSTEEVNGGANVTVREAKREELAGVALLNGKKETDEVLAAFRDASAASTESPVVSPSKSFSPLVGSPGREEEGSEESEAESDVTVIERKMA